MAGKNYRDLVTWQRAMDFTVDVYAATSAFPREEIYGLTSQLRRSTMSIPSNIAEGEGRGSPGDFKRSLSIAHGSLREAETQLILSQRLRYLETANAERLREQAEEVGRLINGLSNSIGRRD